MLAALADLAIKVEVHTASRALHAGSLAWVAALSHLAAAWLCFSAASRARGAQPDARRLRRTWTALALLMLALGVTRQLDLQSWLPAFGRELARQQGWYEQRRRFQWAFIATTVAGAAIAGAAAARYLGRELRELWPTLLAAAFIVAFALIRASSLHFVDQLLSRGPGGVKVSWILELGGVAGVCWGAVRFRGRRSAA